MFLWVFLLSFSKHSAWDMTWSPSAFWFLPSLSLLEHSAQNWKYCYSVGWWAASRRRGVMTLIPNRILLWIQLKAHVSRWLMPSPLSAKILKSFPHRLLLIHISSWLWAQVTQGTPLFKNLLRGRERARFVVPLIYAFIGCFLCVLYVGIKPATLVYWDDALTNWATQPGPQGSPLKLPFLSWIWHRAVLVSEKDAMTTGRGHCWVRDPSTIWTNIKVSRMGICQLYLYQLI